MTVAERAVAALLAPLDDLLACRGYRCGECGTVASRDTWERAWWRERSRRMGAGALYSDEPDRNYGLDEREVCPSCWYVHSDNDMSSVEEVAGTFQAQAEASQVVNDER